MSDLRKMGGLAALIQAATFVIGFGFFATNSTENFSPAQYLAYLAENHVILQILNLILYVVFGVFLVVLSLALHDRLKALAPAMIQVATVFGLIWAGLLIGSGMVSNKSIDVVVNLYETDPAQAELVWLTLAPVQKGLGGEDEIVGGLWVLLVSWAALRGGGLPKALNYLGAVIGVSGILTVIPALDILAVVFGLGLIVWFIAVGIVMLRTNPRAVA